MERYFSRQKNMDFG